MGVQSIDAEDDQFAYRYDTQLLIERRDEDLDEDDIADYITEHFEGNSLIAAIFWVSPCVRKELPVAGHVDTKVCKRSCWRSILRINRDRT